MYQEYMLFIRKLLIRNKAELVHPLTVDNYIMVPSTGKIMKNVLGSPSFRNRTELSTKLYIKLSI